jgi:hypothetical protein
VLRRIFGPKGDEVTEGWKNCIKRNFVIVLFTKCSDIGEWITLRWVFER